MKQERVSRIFLGGKARPERKADNFTAICEPIDLDDPKLHKAASEI
jgi:hypothetical protein